jgi:uncharacterized protein (TIGR02996 family)
VDLEASFLRDIEENPHDQGLWLILADWLQEQPEPVQQLRAELVRLLYELRQDPSASEQPARRRRLQELLEEGLRPPVPEIANSLGMRLALIPAGAFLMGSAPGERGDADERPQHEVEITRPFFLGVFQVTQQEYEAVMDANPSEFRGGRRGAPHHPVESVTWHDAVAFCNKLSARREEKKAGRLYRLPTEAEWEYACRTCTTTAYWWGDTATSTRANFDGNYPWGTAPKHRYVQQTVKVGSYPPNAWGLYDMHGNLREWCADLYDEEWYRSSPRQDPCNLERGDRRILRGGSWFAMARNCRAADRDSWMPDRHSNKYGFRVACTLAG